MRSIKQICFLLMITAVVVSCSKTETPSSLTVNTLGVTNDQGNLVTFNALVSGSSSGGFVYATTPNPTTEESERAVVASFVDTMTATAIVEPSTTYYIRAYAWENNFDVIYGNEITYETGLAIGQEHEGGVIAYFFEEGDPGYIAGEQHGIIMAEEALGTDVAWGCEGTSISEATGMEIGTGKSNTEAIVSNCGEADIAAKLCSDLVLNGYSDWYLPSHDELRAIDSNEERIDGISHGFYFSSSQYSSNQAWAVYVFPPPSVTLPEAYSKSYGQKVMAVRNF